MPRHRFLFPLPTTKWVIGKESDDESPHSKRRWKTLHSPYDCLHVLPQIAIWHWVAFGVLVAALLAMDLLVFHRRAHAPSLKESAGWSAFWIVLALLFNGFVWWWLGDEAGVLFLTGYLVEKALSVDNLFVFLVIFRFFQIPLQYQYRVLFWGILGAVFMRLAFILAGAELLKHFHWMNFILGVLLLYTAFKLCLHSGTEVHPEKNVVLRVARRILRISRGDHREHLSRFFVWENHRLHITPLFLVLLVVESTDVVFAVDSVPAILVITRDPFLVFTSNIFAILGLRALYFVLADVMDLFRYLHYGLAAVLGFIGLKMTAEYIAEVAGWKEPNSSLIPPWMSLAIVGAILTVSIALSILAARLEAARAKKTAMNAHRIRLRKPWRREVTAQGVLWRRKFGCPTGVGNEQTVWVCVEGMSTGGSVAVNGEPLGPLPDLGTRGEYDVTGRLAARNELQILSVQGVLLEDASTTPPGEAFLEIRSS
jgi:tellurite resistance protein TerC